MMKDNLFISHESAETNASNISKSASYFYKKTLSSVDARTTLTANINAKQNYDNSQNLLDKFGDFLENDAKNIKKIDADFTSLDSTMGTMIDRKLTK